EPKRLDAAEMPEIPRERHARKALRAVIDSLNPVERQWIAAGRTFQLGTATPQRHQALTELGLLGYYAVPVRCHPKALRGEGVTFKVGAGAEGNALQVSLPTRAGT